MFSVRWSQRKQRDYYCRGFSNETEDKTQSEIIGADFFSSITNRAFQQCGSAPHLQGQKPVFNSTLIQQLRSILLQLLILFGLNCFPDKIAVFISAFYCKIAVFINILAKILYINMVERFKHLTPP